MLFLGEVQKYVSSPVKISALPACCPRHSCRCPTLVTARSRPVKESWGRGRSGRTSQQPGSQILPPSSARSVHGAVLKEFCFQKRIVLVFNN